MLTTLITGIDILLLIDKTYRDGNRTTPTGFDLLTDGAKALPDVYSATRAGVLPHALFIERP
jgi:hypothetical protein